MTDPRPQPVLDAAKLGGLVSASVVAVGGLVLVIGHGITSDNLASLATAAGAVATALAALFVYVWSVIQGKQAAAKVTPLESPQDYAGQPLLSADQWASRWGKHARQPGPPVEQQEPDEAWTAELKTLTARPTPYPREERHVPQTGIHAHPTKKLGKLAPIPGRAAVPFGRFVAATPAHPIADPAPNLSYPMDHNDVAGDCVVAGLDHTLQTICAALGVQRKNWTDDQILAFYRTQNPGMKSWADAGTNADRGMIIQKFLEHLVSTGDILAFGKIDHTNPDEMRAATYLGLAIVTGETLETAQQSQQTWDYKPSGDWGGHCTCTVGYPNSARQTCVSWGAEVDMTEAFVSHQLDEAWFVLTQEHVDHPGFRAGFDLAGFAAAVAELTNGKVVVPIPAPQPPAPAPTPAPTPAPGPAPAPSNIPGYWVDWAKHTLTLKEQTHATIAVAHGILAAAGE